MFDATEKPQTENNPTYDAHAQNRFEYSVIEDGQKFDTAHVFKSLDDGRYREWLNEWNGRGDDEEASEEVREASVRLWNDLIVEVENIEADDNWKDLIPNQEKIQALTDLLAVAIYEPEEKSAGKRKLSASDTQTVFTECWVNGEPVRQKHVLRKTSIELEKKYSRIQAKRFKAETTRGLRRKPKVEYVPQDHRIGELYDEMFVSQEGFANEIPLRFKTAVIHYIFAPNLDPKK